MLTAAQTMQNISNFMIGKSSLQEITSLAIIRKISDSNLESGRYSSNSGVSPIIWESGQHCYNLNYYGTEQGENSNYSMS